MKKIFAMQNLIHNNNRQNKQIESKEQDNNKYNNVILHQHTGEYVHNGNKIQVFDELAPSIDEYVPAG